MTEPMYQLVITGKLLGGHSYDDVEAELCQLLKLPIEKVRYLLRGERSRINKQLPLEKAERMKAKIQRRGAECEVVAVSDVQDEELADPTLSVATASETVLSSLEPSVESATTEFNLPEETDHEAEEAGEVSPSGFDDLDLDLPDEAVPAKAVKQSVTEEVVLASPEPIAPPIRDQEGQASFKQQGNDTDMGQFYGTAHASKETSPAKKVSLPMEPIKLLALVGVLVIGGLGWAYLNIWSPGEEEVPPAVAQKSPPPEKPVDPQKAKTMHGLDELAKSVKVWMIQFGSGFDPSQVNLEILQKDLEIPADLFVDGWGSPFVYQVEVNAYRLISAGPDKTIGTSDDFKKEVSLQ